MSINLDQLEYIAKNATEGPWTVDDFYNSIIAPPPENTDGHTRFPAIAENVNRKSNQIYIEAFDPPTVLALIDRIRDLEVENERLRERQESADLANEAIRWKRKALDAKTTIQRVRDARSNHPEIPECDRYTPDDTITCGWKHALEDIDKALEGDQK